MLDVQNHLLEFPNVAITEKNGRVYGIWMEGNYYKRKVPYHGSYPPSFLRRVRSMFPSARNILHLFSGVVEKQAGEITVDINPALTPDVCCDVHELSKHLPAGSVELVIADPPYDKKHADIYGTMMPKTHIVMQELYKVVQEGGYVVWLCTKPPLYRKMQWNLAGVIGLHTGTNRVFRAIIILRRKP